MIGRRLMKEEGGFTLPEVIVTMLLMLTAMFALYSVFDMSLRVFSFSTGKVEATESARLGLEKMTREIRAAYPANKLDGNTNLFWGTGFPATAAMPTSGQITFGNDLNGNRRIYDPVTNVIDTKEEITYSLSGTTLQRNNQAAVENVQALTFTYLRADGTTVATSESQIAMVRVRLEVSVQRRGQSQPVVQVLTTDVTLRNRAR